MKNEIEMNPDVLSENNIPTESVKPKTNVVFFLNSGGQFGIGVPFSPEEFIKVYKNTQDVVTLPTGEHSYAVVEKRNVLCYHVAPIKEQTATA